MYKNKRISGLSYFTKEDRSIPVVTQTLYYGSEDWEGPKSPYEMIEIDEGWEEIDLVKKCLPDHKINLIDIREEEELAPSVECRQETCTELYGLQKEESEQE